MKSVEKIKFGRVSNFRGELEENAKNQRDRRTQRSFISFSLFEKAHAVKTPPGI